MDRHGNAKSSALLPDGIESRVVDRQQLSRLVAYAQTKSLQHLQPARTAPHGVVELLHHLGAKLQIVNLVPVDLRENHESIGIRFHHFVEYSLQLIAPHPR